MKIMDDFQYKMVLRTPVIPKCSTFTNENCFKRTTTIKVPTTKIKDHFRQGSHHVLITNHVVSKYKWDTKLGQRALLRLKRCQTVKISSPAIVELCLFEGINQVVSQLVSQ